MMTEEERKIEQAVLAWRFRFYLLLSIFFVITFVYYLPTRFLYNASSDHHSDGHMDTAGGVHDHGLPSASDIAKLPVRTGAGTLPELQYTVAADGTKEFHLTAEEFRWEYMPGQYIHAWGYNGRVPGPTIRVTEGDNVRIYVENKLPVDTSVHWHGVDVPWQQDGVPYLTQPPIKPGETYTYEFKAVPAGTRFYHTHGADHITAAQQLDMGLAGAFIVEPKNKEDFPAFDKEYTMILDEWDVQPGGVNPAVGHIHGAGEAGAVPEYNTFTINGKAFPGTDPINVKTGERVLVRFINAGTSAFHPMHLHGHNFTVVAKDGNLIPKSAREIRNTVTVGPGETLDILIEANNPGPWMLHCHHIHHASAGMMALFKYDGYEPLMQEPARPTNQSSASEHDMMEHSH